MTDTVTHGPMDSATPQAPAWREVLRQRSVLLTAAVLLIIALGVGLGLVALRDQILASEQRMLGALAAATAEQADGTLAVAQTSLRAVTEAVSHGLLVPGTPGAQAALRRRASIGPMFSQMIVLDDQGRELDSSAPPVNGERDHRGAAYVTDAATFPPGVLRIGTPTRITGVAREVIPLSMRWIGDDPSRQGIVLLLADAEFLDGGFARSRPSRDTTLGIYRRNGEPVSDGPGNDQDQLLDARTVLALWADPAKGVAHPVIDRSQARLMVAQQLQRARLLVVVSREQDSVLKDWANQARVSGAFMASALLVALLLSLRNAREALWRRSGEAQLMAERQRALRIFEAAREGAWEWNPRTGQTYLSPRMIELLGFARHELAPSGQALPSWLAACTPDFEGLRLAFVQALQQRATGFVYHLRIRTPQSPAEEPQRWLRLRVQFQRDGNGRLNLVIGTGDDVTEEVLAAAHSRRKDAQLERALRLEALGKLAGGVAHDFNNVLAAVLGYGERARARLPPNEGSRADLDQVLRAGRRGKALVERVLAFSRGGRRSQEHFLAQPVIEEVLALLQGTLPTHVQLLPSLNAPAAVLKGDSTGLFEATLNLCNNGQQAMAGGGPLRVELATAEHDAPKSLWNGSLAAGRWLVLSVQDRGSGIEDAVLPHLFEPFFSTRAPLEGTGLGLAIVHGIVSDFGGAIDLETSVGQGTRFTLYLPLADAPSDAPLRTESHIPRGSGEVILLLEDEPALRRLMEDQLADLGYEPRGFAHVDAARAAFDAEPDGFDLVLTDQVMPGGSGLEWTAHVVQRRPDLPVVILTGFGGEGFEQRALAEGASLVLYKPAGLPELARALDRALSMRGRP